MMTTVLKHFSILIILLFATALSATEQQTRPEKWAQPIHSRNLKNFHRLDAKVCRSAQPGRNGFREIERMGIRNVLSLRNYHSDKDDARGTALKLYRIKMEAGEIADKDVIEALRIIRNSDGPILVHCWHGSDRTGLISAMYRIVFQDWLKDEAIDELMRGGYGYHAMYENIPEYIRKADIAAIKAKVFAP